MALGWKLLEKGEYNVPYDAGLTEKQQSLFSMLLQNYAPSETAVEQNLYALLQDLCLRQNILYNERSAERLVSLAKLHLEGYGVFSHLLADDNLEEIAVIGLGAPVFVCHRQKGWLKTNVVIEDMEFAVSVANKMSRSLGRRLTYQQPRLTAVLEDGSRLHACMSPVTKNGFAMTLRKFRRSRFTVAELVSSGFISPEQAAFLWLVLESDSSVMIAGNTASGKTTLLNALAEFVPPSERIIVIEESPELQWPHEHQVRLVESQAASLEELVWDSLRMRPDRVVLGEARTGKETKALFDVLLSGHAKGAYATFHADSAAEALTRLTYLGVRREDLAALDVVVVARRSSGKRKVEECTVVEGNEVVPVFAQGGFSKKFFQTKFFRKLSLSKQQFCSAFEEKLAKLAVA